MTLKNFIQSQNKKIKNYPANLNLKIKPTLSLDSPPQIKREQQDT